MSAAMMDMCAIFGILLIVNNVYANLCSDGNKDLVARVVFGEARGEPYRGQLAVAYTIVNRVGHVGYPNDVYSVVYQKSSGNKHQYETLDLASHDSAYQEGKRQKTTEYQSSFKAASNALCAIEADPTKGRCAVNFCALDPCAATNGNTWWEAYNKGKIGGHYFVCLRPRN